MSSGDAFVTGVGGVATTANAAITTAGGGFVTELSQNGFRSFLFLRYFPASPPRCYLRVAPGDRPLL